MCRSFRTISHQKNVQALIDPGAVTNLVNAEVVRKLKLEPTAVHEVGISVAVGTQDQSLPVATSSMKTTMTLRKGRWQERVEAFVVENLQRELILGMPFVERYEKHISFRNKTFDPPTVEEVDTLDETPMINPDKFQLTLDLKKLQVNLIEFEELKLRGNEAPLLGFINATPTEEGETRSIPAWIEKEFGETVNDEQPHGLPPPRGIVHRIDLIEGAQPHARAPYRLSFAEKIELEKQLSSLLEAGMIEPSISP